MSDPLGERRSGLAERVVEALRQKGLAATIRAGKVAAGGLEVPFVDFALDFDLALKSFEVAFKSEGSEPIFDSKPAYFHVVRTQERIGPTPYYVEIQERSG